MIHADVILLFKLDQHETQGHPHSVELKNNKFSVCPTCNHKCIAEMEVDDTVKKFECKHVCIDGIESLMNRT